MKKIGAVTGMLAAVLLTFAVLLSMAPAVSAADTRGTQDGISTAMQADTLAEDVTYAESGPAIGPEGAAEVAEEELPAEEIPVLPPPVSSEHGLCGGAYCETDSLPLAVADASAVPAAAAAPNPATAEVGGEMEIWLAVLCGAAAICLFFLLYIWLGQKRKPRR